MQARPTAFLLLVLWMSLPAAADDAPRLVPSADGRELVDAVAGVAWSRCVEGMSWDGRRCTGTPLLATHAEALALARARSEAEVKLWRLPRAPELKRLFERLAHGKDEATLAPAAPVGWYWSGSTRIESEAVNPYSYRSVERGTTQHQLDRLSVQSGWAVQHPGGAVRGDMARREKLAVRLVHVLKP
ncbi:MAG: DUF1566 domain-containing protein [Burkholderiales bacterium]|jgi:hypothetical protein|nr:DUF1566 domain-containing protein [Burkholderiales bacterium]